MVRLQKKLITVLIIYVLVEYIVDGIIYSTIYFNMPENNYNLFSLFHVIDKKQFINLIFIPIEYVIDFFMVGYLISWKFKLLFQEIFTIDKVKNLYTLVLIFSIALAISTPPVSTFCKKIPHLTSVYFTIVNPYYFVFLLKILIFGPSFEEIIYRGIIYNSIKNKYGFIIALITSALIFTSAHIGAGYSWPTIGLYLFLGLSFAFIYEKTKLLCLPIALHSFVNLIVTIKKFS